MLKLDFYIQHLVRENASEIRLSSGAPVRFRFDDGERASAKATEHAQVRAIVEEAAPPAAADALARGRSASFQHASEAGVLVSVDISVAGPDAWNVVVRPATAAAAAPAIDKSARSSRSKAPRPGIAPAAPVVAPPPSAPIAAPPPAAAPPRPAPVAPA